jgi:hypothetical protein
MVTSFPLKDIFATSYELYSRYSKQITRLNTPHFNQIPLDFVSEIGHWLYANTLKIIWQWKSEFYYRCSDHECAYDSLLSGYMKILYPLQELSVSA